MWTEAEGKSYRESDGLDSYELEPEDALELAARLVETAHLVMVRRVMSS